MRWDNMLLTMSLSGAVLIAVIIILRAVMLYRLPKTTFLVLWGLAVFRLLFPLSITSQYSIYTLLAPAVDMAEGIPESNSERTGAEQTGVPGNKVFFQAAEESAGHRPAPRTEDKKPPAWAVVWASGASLCLLYFVIISLQYYKRFAEALPVENEFVRGWLNGHRLRRTVSVRQSGYVKSPLSYGLFHPVILMPKQMDWEDEKQNAFIFAHELVHIKRLDVLFKWILIIALSVHWFNPFVWVMYALCNRDMELSCDEAVIRRFGEASKSQYAHTLIRMEERKRALAQGGSYFSKNAAERRIVAIMRTKRFTMAGIVAACVLAIGVFVLFGTDGRLKGETGAHAPADSDEPENVYSLMAGKWVLDYDRIDGSAFGSGLSYGSELEISATGAVSYYIGITSGGTGQCEAAGDAVTVEITPYESHSEEKEVLTLRYMGEGEGQAEQIEMDWYGETLYWKRAEEMAACTLKEEVFAYNRISYGEFLEAGGAAAEFYHGGRYVSALQDLDAEILFVGEYDEDIADYVLSEEAECLRLQGSMETLFDNVPDAMDAGQFVEELGERYAVTYSYEEGAGTAYYVADRYLSIRCDTSGDGSVDMGVEIALDDSQRITRGSYCWVIWL